MAKTGFVVIAAQTTEATSTALETGQWDKLIVAADALATTEEVDIYVAVGGATPVVFIGSDGNAAKLTATKPTYTLPGGPSYVFHKDVTAASTTVFYYPQPN